MLRAALVGTIGFCIGILIASFVPVSFSLAGFLLLLGIIATGAFGATRRSTYLVIGIAIVCCSLGFARVAVAPSNLPGAFVPLLETRVTFEGVITADPDVREERQRVTIRVSHEGIDTKVLAVAPLFPEVHYGERVTVTGRMVTPEPFATDGGREFRYDRFLAKDGVFALIERAELEVTGPREGFITQTRGVFADLKNGFLESLAAALPEPQASLAGGLVAGGKQGLGDALLDAFIRSGLVHIVVLSGYNVMIVAEAVMRMLSVFPRRIAATGALLTIAAFVLAAGAGAASVRAGVMAGIALFARATYRTYDALRALIAAGLVMLLWNPLLLAYDPGFQLSFVATAGLILGAPIVEKKLAFVRNEFMREIASSTIAAQIAVLPLLLYQNGLFSLVALPANLLVLPVVPLAMAFSALAGIAGFLTPAIAPVIGVPAYVLLAYITSAVEFASALPLAAVTIPAFPFWVVVLAYAGLCYYLWTYWKLMPEAPYGNERLLRSS